MYTRKALAWLTAAATSLALSAVAQADSKSPNGPPGPEGNPNQPQSAPQAPPAQQQSAPNGQANGHANKESKPAPKSKAQKPSSGSKGKSDSAPKPKKPKPKRNGERNSNAAPKGKVWICHATGSETNPYTLINVSVNAWYEKDGTTRKSSGHGGHEDDIFFGPNKPAGEDRGGHACKQPTQAGGGEQQQQGTGNTPTATTESKAETAPARTERIAGQGGVLGAQAEGGNGPADGGGVLGAQADGEAPAAARETRRATVGSLPFTGLELAFVLIAGLAALLGGIALHRVAAGRA